MNLLAAILTLAAISRADLIERFKAAPVIKCDGLVQVSGMCPAHVRREFQLPVAAYAADTCRMLYTGLGIKPRKFAEPGIIVYLGEGIGSNATFRTEAVRRRDGTSVTKFWLDAPAFTDVEELRLGFAKAFLLAVKGETADDAAVRKTLRAADPRLRLDDEYRELADWRDRGIYSGGRDDEDYLKLLRRVKNPGETRAEDVTLFASRLFLYPAQYAMPFCDRYSACTFREAIDYAPLDMKVRLVAKRKSTELLVSGAGHDEKLAAAVSAYATFLNELAALEKSREELIAMLERADELLAAAVPVKAGTTRDRAF